MKKLFTIGLAFLAFAGISVAQVSNGDPAPNFTLTDMEGNTHSLEDFRGQFVVLEFVNPGCPFVVKFYDPGYMQQFQKEVVDAGGVWLAVNPTTQSHNDYMDDAATLAYIESRNVKVPWLKNPEGDVARAYGANRTPEMFLICPEGTVMYQGAIDSVRSANSADVAGADNYILTAFHQASSGEEITTPRTRPYGCTIKF
ncbi:MAG: redoxin domain-containing protein [Opitutales bacterium]|nr:redoxin domain-containing protein [Opitutales bacterium]